MEEKLEIGTIDAAHSQGISIAPFVMSLGGATAALSSIPLVHFGSFSLLQWILHSMFALAFITICIIGTKKMESLPLNHPAFAAINEQYKTATGKKLSTTTILLLLKCRALSVGGGSKLMLARNGAVDHVILARRQK